MGQFFCPNHERSDNLLRESTFIGRKPAPIDVPKSNRLQEVSSQDEPRIDVVIERLEVHRDGHNFAVLGQFLSNGSQPLLTPFFVAVEVGLEGTRSGEVIAAVLSPVENGGAVRGKMAARGWGNIPG